MRQNVRTPEVYYIAMISASIRAVYDSSSATSQIWPVFSVVIADRDPSVRRSHNTHAALADFFAPHAIYVEAK